MGGAAWAALLVLVALATRPSAALRPPRASATWMRGRGTWWSMVPRRTSVVVRRERRRRAHGPPRLKELGWESTLLPDLRNCSCGGDGGEDPYL